MDKIEVAVIDASYDPTSMLALSARLTQRGHDITCMQDLFSLKDKSISDSTLENLAKLPHGTIKRFAPVTIAIVGASRRFLAQARTNQVGFNYVSASLQYSDYTDKANFVVPYEILEEESKALSKGSSWQSPYNDYVELCNSAMETYASITDKCGNDAAGYAMPMGLRNILLMQGNMQSWSYFIGSRTCERNTTETKYIAYLIWEALLNTEQGELLYGRCGPDCLHGACREGDLTCGKRCSISNGYSVTSAEDVRNYINKTWPIARGCL